MSEVPESAPFTWDDLAHLYDQTLRQHVAGIDLRNQGHYRSAYQLDRLFADLVQIARPATFAEVGAFEADISVEVAARCEGTRVVAFEANPYTHAHFSSTRDFAGARVDYVHAAVTDHQGPVTFHIRRNGQNRLGGNNSLLLRDIDSTADTEAVTSPGITLDSWAAQEPGRVCLWIDVEGASGQVLSGAHDTVARCDVLKIEVEERSFWDGQWLSLDVLGFCLRRGLVPVARDIQWEGQYNLLFVSRELDRDLAAIAAIDRFRHAQLARELPGPLGSLRRNDSVRRLARSVVHRRPR